MSKKIIFIDLDGTLIDKGNRNVIKSTIEALEKAKENGHRIVLSTGRPPVLFHGIDKHLDINSYISCNGHYVVYDSKVIYSNPINNEYITELVKFSKQEKIDLSMQNDSEFILESEYDTLYKKFSDNFNMQYPILNSGYYKLMDVYQIGFYYDKEDYDKYNKMFPNLAFHYSCKYGLDVNAKGGMKELGLQKIVDYLGYNIEDTIAIGDGYNDIGMIKLAGVGVAMGNAPDDVKKHADLIARNVNDDAIYHIFKELNLI